MPMVSALLAACDGLDLVSPIAVPAALRIAVSSVAMPTATSQPKNAEPQLRPPDSSRWSARAAAGGGGGVWGAGSPGPTPWVVVGSRGVVSAAARLAVPRAITASG